jgi:FkbM family methyltransferase
MPPPSHETQVVLPMGATLWLPANFPSYRNYVLGMYERDLGAALPSLIQKGMKVLDIGANVGFYTIAASRLVGTDGRVFAFEPDSQAFSYLDRNIHVNNSANVTTVNAAVTDKPGSVSFVPDQVERGFVSDRVREGAIVVPAVSVDSYFNELGWPRIDFVKLDAEGAEVNVLIGMEELSRRNPQLRMVMEYNRQALRRAGHTNVHLAEVLHQVGFSRSWVIERNLEPVSRGALLPETGALYNLLLAKDQLPS